MNQDKLDKVTEDISELRAGQARLEVHVSEIKEDIKYHIKRTDLNEHRIEKNEDRYHDLNRNHAFVKGAAWVLIGLSGSIFTLIKIIEYLNS